jgi:hypothetical protein
MIKRFSLTTLTASTIVKFENFADVKEGTLGMAGTGGIWGPWAMTKDPNRKFLIASDYGNYCQMYGINYGTTPIVLPGLGNLSIPANEIRRLTTIGAKCGIANGAYNNTGIRYYPYGMDVRTNSITGELEGVYWAEVNYAYINFFNFTSSNINISGRVVSPGFMAVIVGNGNSAYSRAAPPYTSTSLWSPFSVTTTSQGLLIADNGNGRISLFDDKSTSISNFPVDKIGFNAQNGYDGLVDQTTTLHHLNTPTVLNYDSSNDRLVFYDSGNLRVRSVDLLTGKLDLLIGNGSSGQLTADPVDSLHNLFRMRTIRDFAFVPEESAMVYIDGYTGYAVNGPLTPPNSNNVENCVMRLWNYGSTSFSQNTLSVAPNAVKNIIGSRSYGCGNWMPQYDGRFPWEVALNYPVGVVYNNAGDIYVSNYQTACIVKLDGVTNRISQSIGLCNTSGDVIGAFGDARFSAVGDLELDSDIAARAAGNFFVVDGWYTSPSRIKYVNLSSSDVTLFNTDPIPQNQIGRIAITDGWTTSVASFDNQICFNQGAGVAMSTSGQNVICMDRETGTETLRVGKASAVTVKGGTQLNDADEGSISSTVLLHNPYGVTFDSEGNLYITDTSNHSIRMVKKWW